MASGRADHPGDEAGSPSPSGGRDGRGGDGRVEAQGALDLGGSTAAPAQREPRVRAAQAGDRAIRQHPTRTPLARLLPRPAWAPRRGIARQAARHRLEPHRVDHGPAVPGKRTPQRPAARLHRQRPGAGPEPTGAGAPWTTLASGASSARARASAGGTGPWQSARKAEPPVQPLSMTRSQHQADACAAVAPVAFRLALSCRGSRKAFASKATAAPTDSARSGSTSPSTDAGDPVAEEEISGPTGPAISPTP